MAAGDWLPLLLLLLLAVASSPVVGLNCLQEGDPGETAPRVVNVQPTHKFRISCYMDPDHKMTAGRTVNDLYFTRDFQAGAGESKRSHSVRIPDSQARVYNGTTLVIEDRLNTAVHYAYTCRLRQPNATQSSILCSSSVNVGHPPLDVKNFSCIVNNWKSITCDWKLQYNAIKSQYQLQYLLKPSYGPLDAPPREQWVVCPQYDDELPEYRTSCSITQKTQPIYRSGTAFYNFTMNITNALGTRLQWLGLVDNFAIVLPAAPDDLRGSSITTNSVLLETVVGFPMNSFPRPLDFDVTYTSAWDQQPQTVNSTSMSAMQIGRDPLPLPLLVTGLYPFTEYLFSVRMRSSSTERDDLWSPPTQLHVRTLPTIPAAAPEVDEGSFQLIGAADDSSTVLIYWRQIEPSQRNGANFSYSVTAWDEAGRQLVDLQPSLATDAYAKFSSLGRTAATTFQVAACNAVGCHVPVQPTRLTVPGQRNVGTAPHSVTLRISGPGQYQLFWQQSGGSRPPDSFTLFSCEHRPDWPYQCQGQLKIWRVSGEARQDNVSLPVGPEYQFAVSANYADSRVSGATSSGMVWSRCSIPLNRDGDQVMQGLSVESTSSDAITLSWRDDCASQAAVAQVVVIYCVWTDNKCSGHEESTPVNRSSSSSLQLKELRPYTLYRVSVALVTGGKQGPRSMPLFSQTLADVSEPPSDTRVTAVTNTSLTVEWKPPKWPNGPLHHYKVLVSGRDAVNVTSTSTSLTVYGLQPFTAYTVSVQACNSVWHDHGCSNESRPASNLTEPGVSGEMESPRSQLLNTSAVLLRWRPPSRRGGPRLVYQLRTLSEVDGVNYTQLVNYTQTVTDDQPEAVQQLEHACRSDASSQRYLFWVRAATVLPSGATLLGPWSEPAQQNCVLASGQWPLAAVIGLVAGGLLLMALAVLVFCLCSRTKRKWVKMRDIGVNLPSGLERPEKGLHAFRSSERRAGPAAGYGRLVSQTAENAATSGRPLLQEECAPVGTTGISEESPASTATDSNSCSSSATNYTDSGAESEKVGSPTYERMPWLPAASHLAPYVQAGGPGTPPAGGPTYTKFSPYVDAKAIQSLLAGGGVTALPQDAAAAAMSRSEPDLSAAAASQHAPPQYSQIGLRSSTGYVSMSSDDALPPPPPADKEPPRPYVALGPPPPAVSAAGFPPYVLAGLGGEEGAPYSAPPPTSAYVARDKLQPAAIELRHLALAEEDDRRPTASAEPVLSPKKLATVASAREPYCRVVTQHQGAAELGPNVSMV